MKRLPRTVAAIASIAASSLLLAACAPAAEEGGPTSLVLGVPSIDTNFDPLNFAQIISLTTQLAYEPLIMWDEVTNTFNPWLAEEFTLSEDRRTMTMELRTDVDFVDGTHFDAAAAETYLNAVMAAETTMATYPRLEWGLSVVATGEYSLEFTSTERAMDQYFFSLLSYVPIVSPAALDDPESLASTPVGTGPYLVDEVVPDVSISFVRNPDYWNPDAFDFDEVTFTVFSDQVAALNALKSGQIDATELDIPLAAEAKDEGFAIREGGGQHATLIILDRDGELVPALADVRVRRAMNLAFDRATIAETLNLGFGAVSSQAFTQGQPEYIEGGDTRYGYDLEEARDLMAEAGYEDGFTITIPGTPAGGEYAVAYEPIVQQSLADIGITVEYEQFADGAKWYEAFMSGAYPVVLFMMFYGNTVDYLVPEIRFPRTNADDAAEEMISTIKQGTAADSAEASQEFGEFLLEEAWFVPFAKPAKLWATIPEVDLAVGFINGLPRFHTFVVTE